MGLEYRNGRAYYYEKKRIGQQVYSRYVCSGEAAELLARLNLLIQEEIGAEREVHRRVCKREAEEDKELKRIEENVDTFLAEFYISHGLHNHKGEWRYGRRK